jgi:hypothetical protein
VLAGKGTLRRAAKRRALASSAPFDTSYNATGGSDGNSLISFFLDKGSPLMEA